MKRTMKALAGHKGRDDDEMQRHFFQRLSVTFMEWSSALLVTRVLHLTTAVIDGVT